MEINGNNNALTPKPLVVGDKNPTSDTEKLLNEGGGLPPRPTTVLENSTVVISEEARLLNEGGGQPTRPPKEG